MLGTNVSTIQTLQIDLSHHLFIKYDIFEVSVNFPPRGNTIGIVAQNCKHNNISYISQLTNNSPCNYALPARNRANVCILVIRIKEPTTVQQVLEAVSIKQLTGKCNMVYVNTSLRDKNIVRTDLQ